MSDEWAETELAKVAQVLMGQSPPGSTYNTRGDGLPFLQGSAEFGEHTPTPVKWCSEPTRIAKQGDLLVSVRAPVGDTNFADQELAYGRGLAVIRGGKEAMTAFLRLVVQHGTAELLARSGGGMFSSITAANLRGFRFSLPPLSVQRRIVDLMEHLDTHIANLESEDEASREFRRALLASLLARDALIPGTYDSLLGPDEELDRQGPSNSLEQAADDGWEVTTLGDIADWGAGGTPKAGAPEYYDGGTFPWAIIGDVQDSPIRDTEKHLTEAGIKKIGHTAPEGSVLVTMYGTIGRVAITRREMATNQAIAWGVPKQEKVTAEFLFHWLRNHQPQLDALARGATQRNINRAILKSQTLALPPLPGQRRIVDVMEHLDTLNAGRSAEVLRLRSLRRDLLSSLLSQQTDLPESYDDLLGVAS